MKINNIITVLAITDSHSVMINPKKLNLNYDYSIHLGDAIDVFKKGFTDKKYYSVNDYIDNVRKNYDYYTFGNHEEMLWTFSKKHLWLGQRNVPTEYDQKDLTEENRNWLLKKRNRDAISQIITLSGVKLRCSHYIITDPLGINICESTRNKKTELLYAEKLFENHIKNKNEIQAILFGHSHDGYIEKIKINNKDYWVINCGLAGQNEGVLIEIKNEPNNSEIINAEIINLTQSKI